jgi:glyoxylase-like metal-dependent hydrolase (beta-lactamase superfamily II)
MNDLHVPTVASFFDPATNTITHVITDQTTKRAAIVDSVLDYDPASGRISYESADAIISHIENNDLAIDWILETHIHADHLSAAPYLQEKLGGKLAIGANIVGVQEIFGKVFNVGTEFERDGSQFDKLWNDGESFAIGSLVGRVIFTPGHTPADVSYLVGDAVFVGDTLFMPDYGSARCDFPGGSANTLFESVQKLYALPDETRMFMCHDYLPADRTDFSWETTVGQQKSSNVHLRTEVNGDTFVQERSARDKTLGMPRLIIPSLQVNIRAGSLPDPEENGTQYLKVPINGIFAKY